jgi:phosphoglycolate phosphatase-like HAD superfamily hydrolase
MKRLVLFDIDGTLTRTQNGYVPFNQAMQKTFGIAADIRSVIPDGNTDPLIVEEIFAKAQLEIKITVEHWQQFAINLHLSYTNAIRDGLVTVRPLPGTLELLKLLSSNESFSQGVVTGNFKLTAQVKLETAGLHSYLGLGAYGCDSAHRADLPAIAKERWERAAGISIRPQQCIIIGDTPKDLHAARKNDMKCVLVGTGRYPVEELAFCEPDACLSDLTDTAGIVGMLSRL